jgi:hypothetical protein
MKKSILFAILALSLNAFAQINPTGLSLKDIRALSIHKTVHPGDPVIPSRGHEVVSPQLNDFTHPSREVLGLIQRFDSIYMWGWDTLGAKLTLESRIVDITYNADNYPLSLTFEAWDGGTWVKNLQFVYTYDANNNQTSLLFRTWDGAAWTDYFQTQYTYDANNNVTSETSQLWAGIAWINLSKYIYTYDANHNLLTETDQSWDGIAWVNDTKTTNTYSNNNLTTSIYQSWNDVNGVWENQSQNLYTYDGNHNLLTYTAQFWNGISWDNVYLETYTYDGNHNVLTELDQSWDGTGWMNVSKTTNTYNGSNNLTNSLTQNWNGASWDNAARTTNTYNGSQLLVKSLNEIWDGGSWKYSDVSFYSYGENDFIAGEGTRSYDGVDNVITSGDSTHYYFKTVAGTKDLTSEDVTLTIYPNPSNGTFTISTQAALGEIEIFNSLGERLYYLKKENGQTSSEIQLTGLARGVYLAVIKNGTNVTNKQILIQ